MLHLQVEAAACVHTNAPSIYSHPFDPSIPRLEGRAAAAAAPAQAGVTLPAILTPGLRLCLPLSGARLAQRSPPRLP